MASLLLRMEPRGILREMKKKVVDITNEFLTPLSLLKISKVFSQLGKGEIMEVVVCDQTTRDYIRKLFLPAEVVSEEARETEEGKKVFHIILKKEEKDDRFNKHCGKCNC